MILWIHDDMHPFEESMLLHGRPSVVHDYLKDGYVPIYQVRDECEQAVFEDGVIRVVDPGKQESIMVPCTTSACSLDIVKAFSEAGYTHVHVIRRDPKLVGGIGYKVIRSHLNCNTCMVQATMEG